MNDVLTEMQEEYSDIDPEEMAESAYCDPEALAAASESMRKARDATIAKQTALAAEMDLLRHLALEGELSLRRDQLQAEHAAVSQRLAQARQQRQGLVEAVQAAGGKLPSWEG